MFSCRGHVVRAVVSLGAVLLAVGAAAAAEEPSRADLERRIAELEAIVRQLMAERAQATPPADPPAPPAPEHEEIADRSASPAPAAAATPTLAASGKADSKAGGSAEWNNGFFIRSADKQFNLRITGQIQSDYRGYLGGFDQVDIDTFQVRRARLGIEANLLEAYEFRLLPDFGSGVARVQDAYLNIHYWDAFQFETGKFKEPFSYEQLIQDRFVPTYERSLIDQLAPARDEGVMLHGEKVFGGTLDWAVGVFNGEINADTDTNDRKDVAARVAVRPFAAAERPALEWLRLGVSATTGVEQEFANPPTLRTPGLVPWFTFNPAVRADGLRNRLSPEISYFYGPLGFAAQYFTQDQEFRPRPAVPQVVNVPFRGFYVLATLLLTGESRTTYSQAIRPERPFDPRCGHFGCGAWELVGRVSRLSLGEQVFAPGPLNLADPRLFSSGCTEMTLGFNWYLNDWVRLQFNWEHAWYDQPIRLGIGPGGLFKFTDALLTRFQVIF